jgi:membrane protease subunit HflC
MRKLPILLILTLLAFFYTSLFTVNEGQRGIILRFGKVLRNADSKPLIYSPGLHMKVPFIESVKVLDARIQTMENQADRFVTNEKKDLIVDSYIKWHISDFSQYYLATGGGNISQAEILLKRKFGDRLRSEIGRLSVKDIVTDSRGRLTLAVCKALNNGSNNSDSYADSRDLVASINSMSALGIEVVDVRIKQINLPSEVYDAIYNRMRAEREADARSQRSKGKEEAEKLRAQADYRVTKTLAEAQRQAIIERGKGDAESVKLFANAFDKDPEFYEFIRSLRAYENSFKENRDMMVIDPDTHFFRYMEELPKSTQ